MKMLGILGLPTWLKTLITAWFFAAIITTLLVAAAAVKYLLGSC